MALPTVMLTLSTQNSLMLYKNFLKCGFLGHLSNSRDLLLWVSVGCSASFINIFFSRTTGPILTKFGMQHLQGKKTRNCKFHEPPPPRGGNFGVKSAKLMYFLENLLLYSQAQIGQTKCIIMMTKEGSTKIVTFMTPGEGVLVLGHGHISHIVKMHFSYKNLLYSQAQIRLSIQQ